MSATTVEVIDHAMIGVYVLFAVGTIAWGCWSIWQDYRHTRFGEWLGVIVGLVAVGFLTGIAASGFTALIAWTWIQGGGN